MRLRCKCPCGLENYNLEDWLSHWKYGVPRPHLFLGRWPKVRAIHNLLMTRISLDLTHFSIWEGFCVSVAAVLCLFLMSQLCN